VQLTTAIHAGVMSLINASHASNMKPTNVIHVGGIDYVEKPRWIGHKPNFPCKIYKGDNPNHLCHGILDEQILWSMSTKSSSGPV